MDVSSQADFARIKSPERGSSIALDRSAVSARKGRGALVAAA